MRERKKIEVECFRCHTKFKRSLAEYKRSEKLGRRHFCSRSCCGKTHNVDNWRRNNSGLLRGFNKGDKFTSFRLFLKTSKYRELTKGITDLTLEYLKMLWEHQKGVCPISGIQMELPKSVAGWPKNFNKVVRASLDRIDNTKGYMQGNVRFVCWMANMCRNNVSDEEVINFCKAVAHHQETQNEPVRID